MQKTFHVIPHTHWDFEWYFSTHESLIQLVYHMEEVMSGLESGENDTYLLDGQLSIIEDYLEQCPEQKVRLTRLVQQGKLLIGPWYTQTDQLIISGESIVRNLMTGIRLGEQFGSVMNIGYVPDAFGQSIDMPKIYQGVGIDKTVFWRGLSTDICTSREFNWQSEDGSEVLGYNIKNGYFVGSYLIDNDDPTPLCHQAEDGVLGHHIAIPLGGDQRYVDRNIKARLAVNNQNCADYTLVESSYDRLFKAIADEKLSLPTLSGEFIDGQVSKIHRSIYSSRYDHKYLNDRVERRLCYQLEPLMVMAQSWGIEAKPAMVANIWKTILRNHAHDSAGGCNTDKTNKIILARYEQADQMSGSAVDYLVRKLAESQPTAEQGGIDGRLTLFNTLPYARESLIKTTVSTVKPHFTLCDLQGNVIAYDVLNTEHAYRGSIQRDSKVNDPSQYYYQTEIAFAYLLPASGFASVQVVETEQSSSLNTQTRLISHTGVSEAHIENEHYRLEYRQGQFHLFDKQQQQWWNNCLSLLDMGDDGDTYDYSPPEQDWLVTLDWQEATFTVNKGQCGQSLVVEGIWHLPKNLAERVNKKCSGQLGYRIALQLDTATDGGSPGFNRSPIVIDAEFDNQVEDHRLQLVVTTPFETQTSWADTPFGIVERVNQHKHLGDWRQAGWKEEPSPIYPMLHYANLHDATTSMTLMAKGVKEYEVRADNQLALTMFRSVGWLGKPDLQRRPGIASGQQFKYIPTPDSQLQGRLKVECAMLVEPYFEPAGLQQAWQHYAVEPLVYQNQSLNQFTNTLKYFVMHPLDNTVADYQQGIDLHSDSLVCSAIKPSEDNTGVLVRLYNPSSECIKASGMLTLPIAFSNVVEVDLMEREISIECEINGMVELGEFKPKQIRSFIIRYK
ncbi:glycoside hydrolase family 38 C-terminal domain-containing protein [Photobacterium satsumensis]|uniref:glycoside hydrolase family 38 N-terminal domain-containing protein n=1 Tax=Photobacterium satsumensis TaxID=2910239 RepID=UPI003D145A55